MTTGQELRKAMVNGVRESNSQYAPVAYSERDLSVKHGPGISRTGIGHRDDLLHPTAYVVLPGDQKMPISIPGDIFRLSSKIRASCKVRLECDSDDTAIRIVGESPVHVQAAIKGVNDAIRGLRTKEARGHHHLLVQPPDGPVYANDVISISPGGGPEEDNRPLFQARNSRLAIPMLDFTPSCHEQRITGLFGNSMSTLQALGCNLRMRVNFGFLRLKQRRGLTEYNLREFVAISDNKLKNRAGVRLDASLCSGVNGTDILKHIVSGLSASLGSQKFDDIEDDIYHTLSLISSDTRIEATITHSVGKDGVVHQRVSGVEMFRRNWKRLDLTSASPYMKHDWNLEVVVKEPVRPKPAWLDDLKHRVSLAAPSKDASSQNPRLQIEVIPELDGIVETILETSVNLQYPNTSYEIIVNATRRWPGTNASAISDPVCTVSMRATNWDESMAFSGGWKQDSWKLEIDKIFSRGGSSFQDGFIRFVQCVIRLQTTLGEMGPMSTTGPV